MKALEAPAAVGAPQRVLCFEYAPPPPPMIPDADGFVHPRKPTRLEVGQFLVPKPQKPKKQGARFRPLSECDMCSIHGCGDTCKPKVDVVDVVDTCSDTGGGKPMSSNVLTVDDGNCPSIAPSGKKRSIPCSSEEEGWLRWIEDHSSRVPKPYHGAPCAQESSATPPGPSVAPGSRRPEGGEKELSASDPSHSAVAPVCEPLGRSAAREDCEPSSSSVCGQ